MLSWSAKRRLTYISILLFFVAIVVVGLYFALKKPPTCTDGIKNQEELGADCGGPCTKVCKEEVAPAIRHWTRFFRIKEPSGSGNTYSGAKYDVAALVENPNVGFGVAEFDYTFELRDRQNGFITSKSGKTFMNPRDKFLIFESGLDTGEQKPDSVVLKFDLADKWIRVDAKQFVKPLIVVKNKNMTSGIKPRLDAELVNDSVRDLTDIYTSATVSDSDSNVLAVDSTFNNLIKRGESVPVSFAWPKPFAGENLLTDIYSRVNLMQKFR